MSRPHSMVEDSCQLSQRGVDATAVLRDPSVNPASQCIAQIVIDVGAARVSQTQTADRVPQTDTYAVVDRPVRGERYGIPRVTTPVVGAPIRMMPTGLVEMLVDVGRTRVA